MNKKAFTLIELLVVVLIIGILAAVALPQYKTAVEKSRMASAIIQVRALAEAEKRYHLANGTYTDNFEDLDISFPGSQTKNGVITQKDWELCLLSIDYGPYARRYGNGITLNNGRWYISFRWDTDQLYCGASATDIKSQRLCNAISGGAEPISYGPSSTKIYLLK